MRKFLWSFLEIFEIVVIGVVVVFFIRVYIAQPFLVSGSSMEPTFSDGDYILIDELVYRFRQPQRGEVIVFRHPYSSSPSFIKKIVGFMSESYFIKRIIGLPGEKVIIDKGLVKIVRDGKTLVLKEPYVLNKAGSGYFEKTLGPNEYFVMGDNRNFSYDSRNWGPLPRENIIGLVRFRLLPITAVKAFNPPYYQEITIWGDLN